eukprot:scaffold3.g6360.t1
MVRIIDGEVVQDDDPRLRQKATPPPPPAASSSRAPPAPAAGGAGVFDWDAPPFRLAPDPPEEAIGGLSGIDLFGAHMRAAHAVAILAAGVFLGLKGLLIGGACWVLYKHSQVQGRAAAAAQGRQATAAAQAKAFFAQLTGGEPDGGGGARRPGAVPKTDPWAGRGPGHRLGSD